MDNVLADPEAPLLETAREASPMAPEITRTPTWAHSPPRGCSCSAGTAAAGRAGPRWPQGGDVLEWLHATSSQSQAVRTTILCTTMAKAQCSLRSSTLASKAAEPDGFPAALLDQLVY